MPKKASGIAGDSRSREVSISYRALVRVAMCVCCAVVPVSVLTARCVVLLWLPCLTYADFAACS